MASSNEQSELELWLKTCLKNENISNLAVKNSSSLDTNDGYVGDIVFVKVQAEEANGSVKNYDLVLKCSKESKLVREVSPMQQMFFNEMHFYETIIPEFTKFQKERGIAAPFGNVPRYYGAFCDENREVMAFENLQTSGYSLWDRKKPMTKKHLSLVVRGYAKFHAISLAMKDQNPEGFVRLTEPLGELFKKFASAGDKMIKNFCGAINEASELLRGEVDEEILSQWAHFAKSVESKFVEIVLNTAELRVISHGDCWNNNFMFQIKDDDKNRPTRVSILDWQITKLAPPASDLAHFLFTSISEEDVQDFSGVLDEYHDALSDYLVELKSDPNIFSREKFLEDWKRYSKMGIVMAPLALKVCTVDREDVIDVKEAAEGGHFEDVFQMDVKDKALLRRRMKHVVQYAVENDLLEF